MAIKKKVTYSVSYTAGTDTLTTKLNSLLQDIVTLILSQNTGLTVLDTITVGSARWTGAPLYDTYVSGLYSTAYNNRHYQSDVYFLGTNEDNLCLSIGFFDGQLVIAPNMTPKSEKAVTDVWSSRYGKNTTPLYAIGKQSRHFNLEYAPGIWNYAIPYLISGGYISMSLIYWSTENSRGYMFADGAGQTDGVNLVIFPTEEGNNVTGLGFAICPFGLLAVNRWRGRNLIFCGSFSEDIYNHMPVTLDSSLTNNADKVAANATVELRQWAPGFTNNEYNWVNCFYQFWHTLGLSDSNGENLGGKQNSIPNQMSQYANMVHNGFKPVSSTANINGGTEYSYSPLWTAYNLPHLESGQAYVRKMRIPGWNPECKGEIYLLWSPVVTAYQSGDIVEVGSKSYAIITEGAVCWAARVS